MGGFYGFDMSLESVNVAPQQMSRIYRAGHNLKCWAHRRSGHINMTSSSDVTVWQGQGSSDSKRPTDETVEYFAKGHRRVNEFSLTIHWDPQQSQNSS